MATDWGRRADELSADAMGSGEPTAWFDRLYAEGDAGLVSLPWNRAGAHPRLEEWALRHDLRGEGLRAVVTGCGLGADAGYLASLGFDTVGFDISPTAVRIAAERFPGIDFHVADLLALPAAWSRGFDLVVEIHTLQALPDPPRSAAAAAVVDLVSEGGTLLAIQLRDDGSAPADARPPFPLREQDLRGLGSYGLGLVRLEALDGPLWRGEYRR